MFSGAAEDAPRWAITVNGLPGVRMKVFGASSVTRTLSNETVAPLTKNACPPVPERRRLLVRSASRPL